MNEQLVPIRIKIVRSGNRMIYPLLNQIPHSVRRGLDWAEYLDHYGLEQNLDKCCDFRSQDYQYSVTCVPEDFANEAVARFPDLVKKLTEAQFQDYWDNHCHNSESRFLLDKEVLEKIKLKRDLGIPEDEIDAAALDPNSDTPGVRRNHKKIWAQFKTHKSISIKG